MTVTTEQVHLVSASAGSGKTYRLTRILEERILSGSVRPEALVATTFTTKAAAELQERVRARLIEAGCHDEALRLGAARIGTVNSVCSRLVSEFALELGLSPELRVLDDAAAQRVLKKALSRVLTEEDAQVLAGQAERMPAFKWPATVDTVVRLARDNGLAPSELRACAQRSLEGFRELLVPPVEDGEPLENELHAALQEFARRVDPATDTTKDTAKELERVRACLQRLNQGQPLPWAEWCSLTGLNPGAKSRPLAARVQQAAGAHERHPAFHRDLETAITRVFDLAARGLEAYADHKRASGVLDFSDQEVLTRRLLRTESVRELLRADLDLVLVDEFQDTSPLQLAIFLELAALARQSVWVGDQKQAIYGFRGADPALMDAALEVLSGGRYETLGASYRSRPPLVRLTSRLFEKAFADLLPPERVVLEPALEEQPGMGPCVEWWKLAVKGKGNQPVHARLATTLKAFLADQSVRVCDPRTGEVRRPTPGDVAVLSYRKAVCKAVAEELESRGVPAALPRQGLLLTHEGLLVRAGLRLWVDPGDALARAELARLTGFASQPEGWLQRLLEAREQAFDDLPAVQELLRRRREMLHAGPLAVVEEVMAAVSAREWCRSWGQPARRLANLEALRSLAFAYAEECRAEGRGCTVAGLVAYLDEVRSLDLDEQASGLGEDAVTVATWHGAKGLEWPVTVLYDLEQRPRADALGVRVASDRCQFDLGDPLAGRWVRFWPNPYHEASSKSALHQRLEEHPATQAAREAERRERLRLLYVGWTRARDVLVLAGRPGVFEKAPLKLLAHPSGEALLAEPDGPSVAWGGQPVQVKMREEETVGPVRPRPTPGQAPVLAGPRPHPPAWETPSALAASEGAFQIGEVVTLGARIPLRGTPDMQAVGEAVHAFLAADRGHLPPSLRLELAGECLARWGVAPAMPPEELLEASSAFQAWVESRWPGASGHRELPLAHRLPSGTLRQGYADLVLEIGPGLVLVDHKTFPGGVEEAKAKALGHAGQLEAYASAVARATGSPVLERWIHLPVSGLAMRVEGS